MNLYVVIFVL